MHEFALGETGQSSMDLDPAILAELKNTRRAIAHRSLLAWAEHCSECAMPDCYATCSLYTPREDLKCRRLDRGIEAIGVRDGVNVIPMFSATFRRWGKLEAQGDGRLAAARAAALIEAWAPAIGRLADSALLPLTLRRKSCKAASRVVGIAMQSIAGSEQADFFVIEVINTGKIAVGLTLTVKSTASGVMTLFQGHRDAAPGYNRLLFAADEIFSRVGATGDLLFQIEPMSTTTPPPPLLFGVADFVKATEHGVLSGDGQQPVAVAPHPASAAPPPTPGRAKVKCVVWDLDNTLWAGTLVEDGADGVRLNAKAAALVVELDRRGILNSIASKNSPEAAENLLERFGLKDYFLYPQIHWEPKSRSLDAIARSLNIGIDSLVLVDDQIFERSEVQHAHPDVEVFDVDILDTMLAHPRFDVPVTEESAKRRSMYQVEQARLEILDQTGGDYGAFLRGCDLKLKVVELDSSGLNRAFELTERTNQLNYSGLRLSRAELEARIGAPDCLVLVLSVSDRFGDYGVIGVASLDLMTWTVDCFFMSCRVQRKKVENAFFGYLMDVGRCCGKPRLTIAYKPTAKNEPSRAVLQDDMGFHLVVDEGGARSFQRPTTDTLADDDIVALEDRSRLSRREALSLADA